MLNKALVHSFLPILDFSLTNLIIFDAIAFQA